MRKTLTIAAVLFIQFSFAQSPGYFIDLLKDNSKRQVLSRLAAYDSLERLDTITAVKLIDEIEKSVAGSSLKMKTRVAALKARLLFYKLGPGDSLYTVQMKNALYKANEMDEEFMIAEYSRWYSEMLNTLKKREQAVQYGLNALQLQEALGIEYFPSFNTFCLGVAEMFYYTKNPEEAIVYFNRALALPAKDKVDPFTYANALNTLAHSYKWVKRYDSSLMFFLRCMDFSKKNNLEDWYYLASDNRFDPYLELKQYDSCKVIAADLYNEGKKTNDPSLLMPGSFMFGRIALRERQFQKAITWLLESEENCLRIGFRPNYRKVYKDLAECYDSIGDPVMAYTYFRKFKHLADSLDKNDEIVSTNYLFAKANFEKEQLEFKKLKARKEKDIMFRNAGIIILIIISALALWLLNRRRKKAMRMHAGAEKQLQLFREEMIAKNHQIETLLNGQQTHEHNTEKSMKMEELAKQIILTEDDWVHFQSMFNKVYPGFFHRLREKANGITEAELRLSSLIRIQLNTRQIAAMQGISPDAVHKTRQRLRQRFSTASTSELEAIISGI